MKKRIVVWVALIAVMGLSGVASAEDPMVGTTAARDASVPPATEHWIPPLADVDVLSINAFAFEPHGLTDRAVLDASDTMRFCNGSPCYAIGPVELPTGAWIRSFDIEAFDGGAEDIIADLLRCPVGWSYCLGLATAVTSGAPGMTVTGVELAQPEYVDNLANSYAIQVGLGSSADTGFFSVSMEIDTLTVFGEGFDFGDLSPWSAVQP